MRPSEAPRCVACSTLLMSLHSHPEREFYVPTDDLGSKAESARVAFEELLCCFGASWLRARLSSGTPRREGCSAVYRH